MNKLLLLNATDADFINYRKDTCLVLQKRGWDISVICDLKNRAQEIKDLGFKVNHFPVYRKTINPVTLIKQAYILRKLLKKESPNYFISYTLKLCVISRIACIGLANLKHVSVFTGMGYMFTDPSLKAQILRKLFLFGGRILFSKSSVCVLNTEDFELVRKERLSEKPSLLKGEGINPKRFKATPEPNSSKIQISFVGRLLKDKGIRELTATGEELLKKGLNFSINIIGDLDPDNPNSLTPNEYEELKQKGFIKLHGYRKDIQSVWAESNIAILLSYREGLPQSLLEAALSKRAIIASNISGCQQIVEHNKTGFLVDYKNINEIAQYLEQLIKDDTLRQKFAEASYEYVSTEFSADKTADIIEQLFSA